jgi:O-methyltransferase
MSIAKTSMIKTAIHKSFRIFGLDLVRFNPQAQEYPPDFRSDEIGIIRAVQPWTMTSAERIYALIHAVRYVSANNIAGAIVECGVWKGGSMAAIARTLLQLQDVSRDLYLFDTFEGMSEPTAQDLDYSGKQAAELLLTDRGTMCGDAPLESVKKVLNDTGYPMEKIHFVAGKVEDTIPASAPESISLLRLDTDWYESTKHELVHLFPRLALRGPIIIDDYGHWKGARQACDEYFADNRIPILLNRIDYTGRIALKP